MCIVVTRVVRTCRGVVLDISPSVGKYCATTAWWPIGHPSLGRRNEYRSKGGDILRLGVKADMVFFAGNTVWSISERVRGVCAYTLLYFTLLLLFKIIHETVATWLNSRKIFALNEVDAVMIWQLYTEWKVIVCPPCCKKVILEQNRPKASTAGIPRLKLSDGVPLSVCQYSAKECKVNFLQCQTVLMCDKLA